MILIDLYQDPIAINTIFNVQPPQKLVQRFFHICRTAEKFYNAWKTTVLNTLILMFLDTLSSAKFSYKVKTVVLPIVNMSENFHHFGLDWNLTLNCQQKHLLRLLFIIEKNWLHFRCFAEKRNTNWHHASWKTKLRNCISESIDQLKKEGFYQSGFRC